MKFWEILMEQIKNSKSPNEAFTFEKAARGNIYARSGNTGYLFSSEGTLLRKTDLTKEPARKPYAPGYTTPQS